MHPVSFRKKLAFELYRQYRKNEKQLHTLNYIFWECTLRCNLNCLHCGSDCKKESGVKDMPVGDFIRAIDEIKDIVNPNKTSIVFTGGEPLMRNDLELCGQKLIKRGFPWGIVSNGLSLTPKRLQSLIDSGMHAITISLDGLQDAHNRLRNHPQSFKKAIQAIELLQHYTGIEYDVVTCVNQYNFNELEQIRDLLISKGVKNWRVFTIFPTGRAKENKELQLPSLQFKQLFDFIVAERKTGKIKVSYGCEGFLGGYEGEVRDNFFFCRAGINVASVLADGSISACPSIRDNFVQGNIYRDNFREIWENKYQIYRDRNWLKTGECEMCDQFKYCDGNGLHLRDESGNLLFCHYHRIQEGAEAEQISD